MDQKSGAHVTTKPLKKLQAIGQHPVPHANRKKLGPTFPQSWKLSGPNHFPGINYSRWGSGAPSGPSELESEMGVADEKAADEESHRPLLGDGEAAEIAIRAAAQRVSTRERTTRWLLVGAVLMNFYTWWYFSPLAYEDLAAKGLLQKSTHKNSEKYSNENWAHQAADIAETLATYDCSGHGTVFMDTLQTSANEVVCECHSCFTGPTCAEYETDCVARVDSGDPVMYEDFWKHRENAAAATLVTPPWYRISYTVASDYTVGSADVSGATQALESEIRTLHELVGNAVTEDKSFVIASGSSQMLMAIVQALSMDYPGKTSLVGLTPFYELYKRQAELFGNRLYAWDGDVAAFGSTEGKNVLEYVTTPNNPTFLSRKPMLNGSIPIFDFAYNWPSMAPLNHAYDEDIMVFTFSKVGGHAGTRLGWAFFRNPELAQVVRNVLNVNALTNSHDSQSRTTQILRAVNKAYIKDNGKPVPMGLSAAEYAAQGRVFHYGRAVLSARYAWLQEIIGRSSRFSLLKLDSEYCAFFGQILPPSPVYAWVYCNRDEDADCYNVLLDAGISTYSGANYGVTARHVRLSLFKRDSDYQQLEKYLSVLVAS
ncbi:unnamed protein product [Calypogeia fissa]